jgi:bifunctional UDP-N-acetylglucosamine pyrophosphorylase/glucosamine-1-phosphate N-acetyltransferase
VIVVEIWHIILYTGEPFMGIREQEENLVKIIDRHMENGVIFYSAAGIVIDENVKIGKGTVIFPGTILLGDTRIGENCHIGPNSMVKNSYIGDNVVFNSSQAEDSFIDSGCNIGPFSHLRPNSKIDKNVKVGNFVEIKNSNIGRGTSVAHLTYIGDSDVGKFVNFGCGVVTVNYDGQEKKRTTVGDYAFIGCNTNLIAPVKVGNMAYTAAGSTINRNVPDGALAVARSKQENKNNWAAEKLSGYKKKHSHESRE